VRRFAGQFAGRACWEGERAGRSPPPGNSTSGHRPPGRRSSHGFHLHESHHQKEHGDPDSGPTQLHGCLSLWLQGVPEPGLVPEDSRDNSSVRCDQVNGLLNLVAELKKEVERLRNIRECGREINWWNRTLPSLKPRQQEAAPQEAEDPLPSCRQGERGDLRDWGNGNGSLLGVAGKSPPDLPHLPSCP